MNFIINPWEFNHVNAKINLGISRIIVVGNVCGTNAVSNTKI